MGCGGSKPPVPPPDAAPAPAPAPASVRAPALAPVSAPAPASARAPAAAAPATPAAPAAASAAPAEPVVPAVAAAAAVPAAGAEPPPSGAPSGPAVPCAPAAAAAGVVGPDGSAGRATVARGDPIDPRGGGGGGGGAWAALEAPAAAAGGWSDAAAAPAPHPGNPTGAASGVGAAVVAGVAAAVVAARGDGDVVAAAAGVDGAERTGAGGPAAAVDVVAGTPDRGAERTDAGGPAAAVDVVGTPDCGAGSHEGSLTTGHSTRAAGGAGPLGGGDAGGWDATPEYVREPQRAVLGRSVMGQLVYEDAVTGGGGGQCGASDVVNGDAAPAGAVGGLPPAVCEGGLDARLSQWATGVAASPERTRYPSTDDPGPGEAIAEPSREDRVAARTLHLAREYVSATVGSNGDGPSATDYADLMVTEAIIAMRGGGEPGTAGAPPTVVAASWDRHAPRAGAGRGAEAVARKGLPNPAAGLDARTAGDGLVVGLAGFAVFAESSASGGAESAVALRAGVDADGAAVVTFGAARASGVSSPGMLGGTGSRVSDDGVAPDDDSGLAVEGPVTVAGAHGWAQLPPSPQSPPPPRTPPPPPRVSVQCRELNGAGRAGALSFAAPAVVTADDIAREIDAAFPVAAGGGVDASSPPPRARIFIVRRGRDVGCVPGGGDGAYDLVGGGGGGGTAVVEFARRSTTAAVHVAFTCGDGVCRVTPLDLDAGDTVSFALRSFAQASPDARPYAGQLWAPALPPDARVGAGGGGGGVPFVAHVRAGAAGAGSRRLLASFRAFCGADSSDAGARSRVGGGGGDAGGDGGMYNRGGVEPLMGLNEFIRVLGDSALLESCAARGGGGGGGDTPVPSPPRTAGSPPTPASPRVAAVSLRGAVAAFVRASAPPPPLHAGGGVDRPADDGGLGRIDFRSFCVVMGCLGCTDAEARLPRAPREDANEVTWAFGAAATPLAAQVASQNDADMRCAPRMQGVMCA